MALDLDPCGAKFDTVAATAKHERMGASHRASHRLSPVGTAVAALRRGREAIVEIDGQLDVILDYLADPSKGLAAELPDRMAFNARRASEALAALSGPAGSELF